MNDLIDGVRKIQVPTPFPVGDVNCYLIEGEPLTLIDVGPQTSKSLAEVERQIRSRSYELSDIEQILLTHGHIDHIGLAAQFVEARVRSHKDPTEVWIHHKDAEAVLNYQRYAERYEEFYDELVTVSGVPEKETMMVQRKKITEFFKSLVGSVPTAHSFEDHTSFKTGIGELSTIWVPGHSSGSTCYACDEKRVVFSGDHILGDISSNPSIAFDNSEGIGMLTYLNSLNRILSKDGYVALPGHREPILAVKSRVEALRSEYDDKIQRAADLVTNTPKTVYEVSRLIYGDYDASSLILALAESRDLLMILEKRNQAELINKNGVIYAVSSH